MSFYSIWFTNICLCAEREFMNFEFFYITYLFAFFFQKKLKYSNLQNYKINAKCNVIIWEIYYFHILYQLFSTKGEYKSQVSNRSIIQSKTVDLFFRDCVLLGTFSMYLQVIIFYGFNYDISMVFFVLEIDVK